MSSKEELINKLRDAVVARDRDEVVKIANEIVRRGDIDVLEAIEKGVAEGARIVGEKFERMEIFLTDLILAAEAMKAGVDILLSKLPEEKAPKKKGSVVIGTVAGDIHDIGKNIVVALLRANGFEVYDLGTDVPPAKFVEEAEKVNADIIAMSALMTSTVGVQKDVIEYLKDTGKRGKFAILVGGGAATAEWAEEIGADGYGETAIDAVKEATRLMEVKRK